MSIARGNLPSFGVSRHRGRTNDARPTETIENHQHEAQNSSALVLRDNMVSAPDNPIGHGRDLYVSSGMGGQGDGSLYLCIGGEPVITIDRINDTIIEKGDVILREHSSTIRYAILRETVSVAEGEIPEVILDSTACVLTVDNLGDIDKNTGIKGTISNTFLNERSFVIVTPINNSKSTGVPYVWLSNLKDGAVDYNILCVHGELESVTIHLNLH